MIYAQVINGHVARVDLPLTGELCDGRTVSNYSTLDTEILAAEGWLPLKEDIPAFNTATQTLSFDRYEILPDKVIRHYVAAQLPPAPSLPVAPPSMDERLRALENAMLAMN